MSIDNTRFRLRVQAGNRQSVVSVDELVRVAMPALRVRDNVVSLELEMPSKPGRTLETKVYRFLGVNAAKDVRRLTLYSSGDGVFATYEEEDAEWVASSSESPSDKLVSVRTEAGEPFLVSANDFISTDRAVALLEEFFKTGRKPESQRWREHG